MTDYSITPTPDHDHGDEHDEWFRHTSDEPDAQEAHGEINPGFIIGFLSLVIVATFAVAVLFLVYFQQAVQEAIVERREAPTERLAAPYREATARWNQELHGQAEWQDEEAGFVALPLDLAKQSVMQKYSQDGAWRNGDTPDPNSGDRDSTGDAATDPMN